MNDQELIARLLFDKQTVLLPTTEIESYRVAAELKSIDAKLVIISKLDESSHQAVQENIFNRMLPRVPEQSSKVIYTNQSTFDLHLLSNLPNVTNLLLCGIEPLNKEVKKNVGFSLDGIQVMATENIEEIDANAPLKKTMWQEWMKQFTA